MKYLKNLNVIKPVKDDDIELYEQLTQNGYTDITEKYAAALKALADAEKKAKDEKQKKAIAGGK